MDDFSRLAARAAELGANLMCLFVSLCADVRVSSRKPSTIEIFMFEGFIFQCF